MESWKIGFKLIAEGLKVGRLAYFEKRLIVVVVEAVADLNFRNFNFYLC